MEIRLLAKNKSENRIEITCAGAIKPLISLISSSDPELQEYGITAILNLSLYNENKELIASSGAIEPLVRALKVGTSTARENAACAHLIKVGTSTEHQLDRRSQGLGFDHRDWDWKRDADGEGGCDCLRRWRFQERWRSLPQLQVGGLMIQKQF
ncbi:protein spotted leaf 11-like [Cornus florida]|uniref:protein spotted leaf 11-like n=1 Tax=Cornus florida TaxID=4283 RepID=UPI00289F3B26|nr:protein spotted leaf 11-like [Cornus florida]